MRKFAISALVLIPVTLAACSSSPAGSAGAAASSGVAKSGPTQVKVAIVPSIDAAALALGDKQGFFADQGLKLDISLAASGPAGLTAVVSDSVQVSLAANVALLLATAKKIPIVAVAAGAGTGKDAAATKIDELVVRSDSGITSFSGLVGKTVAVVAVKNSPELYVRKMIDEAGGDSSKTNFVAMPFPEMATALKQKRVDAVAINEPFYSALMGQGGVTDLGSYIDGVLGASTSYTYWFSSKKYAAADPKVISEFQAAMAKSNAFADAHPDQLRAMLPGLLKVSPEVAAKVNLPTYDNPLEEKAFEPTAGLMQKYGLVPSAIPLDGLIVHGS